MSRAVRVRAVLGLGAVAAVAVSGTWASWTASRTAPGLTAHTGHLDLQVNGADPYTAFTALSYSTLKPGDTIAAILTVTNAGTVPLSYWAEALATNADGKGLAAALSVKVTGASSVTGTNPSGTCGGTVISPSATAFSTSTASFVYGAAQAARKQLAAGASNTICVQATLPASAPNTLEGATTSVSFSFHGLQVGAP